MVKSWLVMVGQVVMLVDTGGHCDSTSYVTVVEWSAAWSRLINRWSLMVVVSVGWEWSLMFWWLMMVKWALQIVVNGGEWQC